MFYLLNASTTNDRKMIPNDYNWKKCHKQIWDILKIDKVTFFN